MASFGTPKEGVSNVIVNLYNGAGLKLILYTDPANSFDRDSVYADITEPSSVDSELIDNGYAPIVLTGTFSGSGDVISYDHGGGTNPTFENTGVSEPWDEVFGCAIVDSSESYILHFRDFGSGVTLDVGETIPVVIRAQGI